MSSRGRPFDVLHCLRLAKIARWDPVPILRDANKPEIAGLLEELFGGTSERVSLTDEQRTVLERFDALDVETRNQLLIILNRLWTWTARGRR